MKIPRFGLNRFDARSVDAFAADVQRAEALGWDAALQPDSQLRRRDTYVLHVPSGREWTLPTTNSTLFSGDGTMVAIQKPRLIGALQGVTIDHVACGSAHTMAWSTSKQSGAATAAAAATPRTARVRSSIFLWTTKRSANINGKTRVFLNF